MKLGVNLKIDVSKIDKNKLFKGAKGTYLDAQVFIDIDPDKYGNNGMITQAVTKEEKQAGQLGAILGNAKIFWNDSQQQQQHQQGGGWGQPQQPAMQKQPQQQQSAPQQDQPQYNESHIDFDEEIPFAPIALQYRNILNAM